MAEGFAVHCDCVERSANLMNMRDLGLEHNMICKSAKVQNKRQYWQYFKSSRFQRHDRVKAPFGTHALSQEEVQKDTETFLEGVFRTSISFWKGVIFR